MTGFLQFCHFTGIIFILCFGFSYEISCKDEANEDVDWYINYKLPVVKEEPEGSFLKEGSAYAYITAPGSKSWTLSSESVMSETSMLGNTLEEVYSNKKGISYLFYNDDPPEGFDRYASGHLKGVVAFDEYSGFWLVHSIPTFPDDEEFEYPENALVNGQSVLCVTFNTEELNEICNQLLYSKPDIYSSHITPEAAEMLDETEISLFSDKPEFKREEPFTRTATLKSLKNKLFKSFVKVNRRKESLYKNILAPDLKCPLLVETWRKGSGGVLKPSCKSEFSIQDIVSINMRVQDGDEYRNISFSYTKDHSKWAISEDCGNNWVCIADINRMKSQEKRGGGALCFESSPVHEAFSSIISGTRECRNSRKRDRK